MGGGLDWSGNEEVLGSGWIKHIILKGEPTGSAGGMFLTVERVMVLGQAASVPPGSQ